MNPNDPTLTQEPGDPSEAAWDAGMAAAFGPAETGSHHPAADPEAGTILAGKYRLAERIGEGGMGSVWVAHQSEPVKRKVAVKLIKVGMDSRSVLARFEAERQALAVMDHPNIAKVLDGGLHDGRPFFVMELVKGVPITEYCDARKSTPKQRLELFVPVCQAIQHAHQKGIIHRDIKPSNVLIALYDDKPVPKVIDFGIAKATGGTLTEHTIETAFGGVIGTPQYMSPEQASLNNLDIDTRSDVYSLGVLLYELLTGSPPFARKELEKKGLLEILRVVREEEPPRPSTKLSTADALPTLSASRGTEPKKLTGMLRNELDWIVMKALEKDRARRYETANGFAADVNRYLSGEAVQAHPPSTTYRMKKFVRRNRGQVIAAGLVLFALFAGIIGTTLGLIQADRARGEEAKQRQIAEENEAGAKQAEAKAVASGERAKKSEARARLALDNADKILGIQQWFRPRGGNDHYSPDQFATLQGLAAQFEAVAKAGTDADSAEAFNRLATVQVLLEKPAERDQSLAASVRLWTELVRTDPANANEHRVQLAKVRARQLEAVEYKSPPDPRQIALTRQVAADWKAATDADPVNAMAWSERATVLNSLAHLVCPSVPYPESPPPDQLAEKAAIDREALACMTQAVELRPDDQSLWIRLLRLHGDAAVSPAAIRACLHAALRFPDEVAPRRYSMLREEDYPYSRVQSTYDSDLLLRLVSARLDPAIGEWKANPAWRSDEAYRRMVAEPCRGVLNEFPNYKYARGIEFLLILREARMAEWVPLIPSSPTKPSPTPTAEQRRRAAELYRRAIELSRKPETRLPTEFLTLRLRDKGDVYNDTRKQHTTPITAEEYVWFHRLGGNPQLTENVLAELQGELAIRTVWRPTPMFLHRILLATLPDEVLHNAATSKEKLIARWTQADALFSRIQSEVAHDSEDYRKVAERFSAVAVSIANRFHRWGDRPRARAAYTRCIQLLEENPARPENDESRYRARCYFERANVNLDSGDWNAALADYQTALVVSKKKPGEFDNLSVPGLEPLSHFRSGIALLQLGKFEEAEKAFDECLRFRREEKHQSRPLKSGKQSVPWIVAVTEHDRAQEYLRVGRWEAAAKWARQGLITLDENEEAYPIADVIRFRYSLHTFQANSLDGLKQNEAAVREWDEARKYATPEQFRRFAVLSAASYARVGRHEEVAKQLEEIANTPSLTPGEIYDLGCAFASASIGKRIEAKLAESYRERAMAMLQRATKAGWKNADHAKRDSDLDPLRDRADFKKLMAEWEKK